MKMKKLKMMALTMTMAVVLTACGSKSGNDGAASGTDTASSTQESSQDGNQKDSQDSNTDGEEVTITVWGEGEQQALYGDAFAEINAAFEKANPDIKIDYQWSGSFDSLTVAVQTDSLPDVFYTQGNKNTSLSEMAANGYLLPLDEYIADTSRFPEDALAYATVDDVLYSSLPAFFDYAVVFYNADIFAKYELEAPKTWDEFLAVCKTLQDNGELPMAYGGNGWLDRYWLFGAMAPAYMESEMVTWNEGGEISDYAKVKECFEDYRAFLDAGYAGTDYAATDMASAQLSFTNGQGAMIVDGTWNKGLYETMNIGCFPIPGKDGKGYSQSGPSQSLTYSASAKTEHPEAVGKYLAFLSSEEAEQIMFDHVPSIPIVDGIAITDPVIAAAAEYDVIGQNLFGVLSFAGNENSQPADLFTNDVLPKLMTGEYTVDQALELFQKELEK